MARNAHLNLSKALMRADRLEEALAAARIALKQRPDEARSYTWVGHVLANLKRLDEAEENFQRALEIDPSRKKEIRGLVFLGRMSWQWEQIEAAERYLRRALELDPRNREALEYLARSCLSRKRYREALDLYRKLAEVDPGSATTHNNIAGLLYHLGQSEAAVRSFQRALSLDPTLEEARTGLEEARKTVRQAVQ